MDIAEGEEIIIEELPSEYSPSRFLGNYGGGGSSRSTCSSPHLSGSSSRLSKNSSPDYFFHGDDNMIGFSNGPEMFSRFDLHEKFPRITHKRSSLLLGTPNRHAKNSSKCTSSANEIRNFSSSISHSSHSSSENCNYNRSVSMYNQHVLSPTEETSPSELKIEQKRVSSSSKTKITTDRFSSEEQTASDARLNKVEAGSVKFEEKSASSARKSKLEVGSVSSEEANNKIEEERSLHAGDTITHDKKTSYLNASKLKTDSFSSEEVSAQAQREKQVINQSSGTVNESQSQALVKEKTLTDLSTGISTKTSEVSSQNRTLLNNEVTSSRSHSQKVTSIIEGAWEDILNLEGSRDPAGVLSDCSERFASVVDWLKSGTPGAEGDGAFQVVDQLSSMMGRAWKVPEHGFELGSSLSDVLRDAGALDLLLSSCASEDAGAQLSCARLLEHCLTPANLHYVAEKGLDKVVRVARHCTRGGPESARVGVGIIKNLFRGSEDACGHAIRMGALDAVLQECKTNDVETLRNCASALANLALHGGSENQRTMISHNVPTWLFPLAFHDDDSVKYYACLAVASLVANKEIEADVIRSGSLDLVEPFVLTHKPSELLGNIVRDPQCQSKSWLQKLVPVLLSERKEARKLAAFHFAMEADVNKRRGLSQSMKSILEDIGAIEPLKEVASSPNAAASNYAAEALRLIDEEVPHKLSQQVVLWSVEDVKEWIKQIGFSDFCEAFVSSRVDGDILMQLDEDMLKNDINMNNGILRKRFMRELNNLKKMADYSSCDATNLNHFLRQLGVEFSVYTYQLLKAGIHKDALQFMREEAFLVQCGVSNTIHRAQLLDAIRNEVSCKMLSEGTPNKTLDVFISYRRSNGSQLASLLKVHMHLRGFSAFIDVERLEAGKFDNNLLNSIRQAKNFLLVLTQNALARCVGDVECKDWVHKEIVTALQTGCNIIPILDNFQWPDPKELPEDMQAVCFFNGVRWIHDYQDACVDKIERFLSGETSSRPLGRISGCSAKEEGDCAFSPGQPGAASYSRTHSHESRDSRE